MSDYNIISTLNEQHKVYLVQSALSGKVYVQKVLDVYNIRVYEYLYRNPVAGIPRLINYYEQGDKLIVIEEYISGISLQEKIDNSELNISDIRSYMIMLCNILEALHSMTPPIIHRDIKPSNIIITSYNYAMLLDFNAAKQFSGQNESDTVLIGTPGYAAPEQYGFGSSSPQTDIYSLGIVLKEMLSSVSSNPAGDSVLYYLNQIAERCTQMTPSARYQSVAELKNVISQASYQFQDSYATGDFNPYTYTGYNTTENNTAGNNSANINTRFLPPGFRTKTPWKMLLSSVVYLFITWLCLSLEMENTYGAKLWLERVFCLGMFLFTIFCGFNYLNIQNILPLCKNKNRILHYVGIILLDVAVIFSLFVIMFIMEAIFFPVYR
ncbi:serine/threonine-protein kinase [Agathobacter sp.]